MGSSGVDLSGTLALLPPDSARYVQAAMKSLNTGDYFFARYYVELALEAAQAAGGTNAAYR
jgi:hypothetical protein